MPQTYRDEGCGLGTRAMAATPLSQRHRSRQYRALIRGAMNHAIGAARTKLATTTIGIRNFHYSCSDGIDRTVTAPMPNKTALTIP
jgi:hypothetical protein